MMILYLFTHAATFLVGVCCGVCLMWYVATKVYED